MFSSLFFYSLNRAQGLQQSVCRKYLPARIISLKWMHLFMSFIMYLCCFSRSRFTTVYVIYSIEVSYFYNLFFFKWIKFLLDKEYEEYCLLFVTFSSKLYWGLKQSILLLLCGWVNNTIGVFPLSTINIFTCFHRNIFNYNVILTSEV